MEIFLVFSFSSIVLNADNNRGGGQPYYSGRNGSAVEVMCWYSRGAVNAA